MKLLARGSGRVDRSLRGRQSNLRTPGFSPSNLQPLAWFDPDQARAPGSAEGALRLPGTTGSYVWAPDTAALSITGDLEIVVRVALSNWLPSTYQALVSKWVTAGSRSYHVAVDTAGKMRMFVSGDGTEQANATSSVVTGIGAGTTAWLKWTWRASDGRVQFWTATDQETEPTGTWAQLGSNQTIVTIGSTIFDGGQPLEIGAQNLGATNFATIAMRRAIVRSGIGGTVVADFDASRFVVGRPDFVDDYSNRWMLMTNSVPGFGALLDVMLPTGGYPESAGCIRQPGLTPYTQYMSMPDAAALDITGDIEVVMRIAADNWQPTTQQKVAGKWSGGAGDRSWELEIGAGAAGLRFWTSPTGAGADLVNGLSTVPVSTAFNGRALWIKATLDVDDGAGNRVYKFYTATDDSQTEPAVWTQLGATVTTAGTTSIFAGAGQLNIGANAPPSAFHAFAGKVYRALVRSGIGGTLVADFNASRLPYPYRSYVDTVGSNAGTWTVNGWSPTMVGHAQAGSSAVANSNAPLTLHTADTAYVYMPGASTNRVRLSSTVATATDLDVMVAVALDAYTTTNRGLAEKDNGGAAGDANVGWAFRIVTADTLELRWQKADLSVITTATCTATLASVGVTGYQAVWLGVTLDADNGAGGYDVKFWFSKQDPATAIGSLSWTQLGATVTGGATTTLNNSPRAPAFMTWGGTSNPAGRFFRGQVANTIGGAAAYSFDARLCAQTGYTDAVSGIAWVVDRATSGRKSTLVGGRSIAVLGTDDYYVMPKGAIPSALVADNASVTVVARPWATMGSNNQWLSLRAGTGVVPGMEIVTRSATTIASRTLTTGTYTTSLGATVTMGQQTVATMVATPGSPGPHLLRTNTAITALVNRTGSDETGTTYGYIGSLAGSLQFIDYELSGVLTAQGAWSATDHGRLVAYYGGGS